MRRNSPKMMVVRALEAGKVYVPFAFLQGSIHSQLSGWAASAWLAMFWYYSVTRVSYVFLDWLATKYEVTASGIRIVEGLTTRRETAVAWTDIASVQVSQSALHRILRCSAVQIGIGSQSKGSVTLEAVSASCAEAITSLFRAGSAARSARNTAARFSSGGERIFEMGKLDYLLISIAYGQFALLIPFAFGLYTELSTLLSLPHVDLWLLVEQNPSPVALAATAVAVACVALAYGLCVAWLRYGSFTVVARAGILEVTGGVIAGERRQVQLGEVLGVRIRQNPLMVLMHHATVSLVLRESGSRLRSNVIFPSIPRAAVGAKLSEHFPQLRSSLDSSIVPPAGLRILIGCSLPAIVLCAIPAMASLIGSNVRLPVVVCSLAALLLLANRLWAAVVVDVENGLVCFRRGFLWVTQYVLPVSDIHVFHQRQGPARRGWGFVTTSLWVHDGRPRALRAPACPMRTAEVLSGGLPPVAAEEVVSA